MAFPGGSIQRVGALISRAPKASWYPFQGRKFEGELDGAVAEVDEVAVGFAHPVSSISIRVVTRPAWRAVSSR